MSDFGSTNQIASERVNDHTRDDDPKTGDSSDGVESKRSHSPIRDDPIHDKVLHGIMAYSTVTTIILLKPVKKGLRKGHCHTGKPNDGSGRPLCDMSKVEVEDIESGLDYVQESCSLG